VTALWGALLVGASLLWPMTYGYDESQHVDMAYVYSAHPFRFYGPGELKQTQASIAIQIHEVGYPPRGRFDTAPIAGRDHRPSFADLGGRAPSTNPQPDQMVQHPPLYYWAEAVVLRLPGVSHLAFDVQIWLMRLLSVLFVLPLPWLCWLATRRLLGADEGTSDDARGGSGTSTTPDTAYVERAALLAAIVPLTIPNLVRDGSSVTNDSLLIGATSVLLYLLCRVVTGDLGRRTAIGVAASLAITMWTKGFGLLLTFVVLLAYLIGVRDRTTLRPRLEAVGIAAVGGVVGGVWWLRNVVEYGALQPNGYGGYQDVLFGKADNSGSPARFIRDYTPAFIRRLWSGIGLPEPPAISSVIVYGWFAVVIVGFLAALVAKGRERDNRLRHLVIASATLITFVAVTASSWSQFHKWSSEVRGVQGRYVYHTVVAIAALAVIGWTRFASRRVLSYAVVIVLLAALATQVLAWFAVVRRWYQPLPGSGNVVDGLHGVLRWSPVPEPITVLFVFVTPVLAGALALWFVARDSLPRTSRHASAPPAVAR
jgi:4-amino-4-deoxy-L-arabinose transferase-like glycosyltransferase